MAVRRMSPDGPTALPDAVQAAVSEWRRNVSRSSDRAATESVHSQGMPGPGPDARHAGAPDPRPPDPRPPEAQPGIIAALPRRPLLKLGAGEAAPPQMKTVEFTATRLRSFLRLFVWLGMILRFGADAFWDRLRRRSTPARRAVRLRRIFERTGGTFIKIGQHLAMRLDLLPWDYGNELAAMLDRVPPFPSSDAIKMVERATGRPLEETFSRFDPDPVGSASVACTYQAILRTGERVVVKVRRPGVGELFMADLKVFDWLASVMEFFTVLRPGYTQSMRRELRETLVEQLDFVREARYVDLFRRAARDSGKRFFTAPRVYFELSGEDVIVEEFVAGMWLRELLAAVEQKNHEVLELARKLEIDPQQIARRLAWINYWGWHEHFFFRSDPHPDRVIIGEGGRLTFIDFSSVGAIGRTKRRALQQSMYFAWKQDPLNMARASLVLLEPLPSVDPKELTKELEAYNWQMLFAFETRQTGQGSSNRTSAWQWLGLIRLARRFGIVIDFHVLRLLRGTVMSDTIAVRLDPEINVIKEYRRFARYRAARARQRVGRKVGKAASRIGDNNGVYLHLEQIANTGENLFFRLRHALSIPRVHFSPMMSKASLVVYSTIRLAAQVLAVIGLMTAWIVFIAYAATGQRVGGRDAFDHVVSLVAFRAVVVLLVLINARKILFRMDDKDS
jgi:ubiquinone biosynthesis protein